MNIVVCGGSGFLGSNCISAFSALGANVMSLSRPSGFLSAPISTLQCQEAIKMLASELEKFDADVLLNCWAMTDVAKCETAHFDAYTGNTLIPCAVARACAVMEVPAIHISTDQVYGRAVSKGRYGWAVGDEAPLTQYGYTKLFGEKYMLDAGAIILRTNFIGLAETSGRLNFLSWVARMIETRQTYNMSLYDNHFFNPVYVTDLVDLIWQIMTKRVLPSSQTINVGCSGGISKGRFIERLLSELDIKKPPKLQMGPVPRAATNSEVDLIMDVREMSRLLGSDAPTLNDVLNKAVFELSKNMTLHD